MRTDTKRDPRSGDTMNLSAIFTFILCSLRIGAAQELRLPPSRIAIVGAGIGGTSAAYFIRQKYGKHVQIDIFEKANVGGRLATVEMDGNEYEAGGSVIHPLNLHMKSFVKELGLNTLSTSVNRLGYYNGNEFVFQESDWYLINLIKMQWNYGLNFLRMSMWVEDIFEKFMRIYQYQTFDYSFSSTESLFHAMGGNDYTANLNTTMAEAMQKSGFSQKFIDDIVVPTMRYNFLQGVEIHAFVGAVSMTGTDSGLWSVEGGNKMVCSGLIHASKAQLIQGTVTTVQEKVHPTKSGGTVRLYEVNYETSAGPGQGMYDIILLAIPLNKDFANIDFLGIDLPIKSFSKPYQQTVTTLVHGRINASFFGCSEPCQFNRLDILTTDNPETFICSINSVSPVKPVPESDPSKSSDLKVWKISSPEPLTDNQLHLLFESYNGVTAKTWLAYPKYTPPAKMPPVILHHGIYYINSMEWAASAMEMSAISAKNVVLLSHHRWYGKDDHIDQEDLSERLKSEL